MKNFIISFLCLFASITICLGQDDGLGGSQIIVPDGNSYYEVCSGTFTSRLESGEYRNNENYHVTICPQNHDLSRTLTVRFTQFNLENTFDFLEIFDENRSQAVPDGFKPNSSKSIDKFTGTNSPGTISSSKGCLTFRFTSDSSVTKSGWRASVSCGTTPPPPPTCRADRISCGQTISDNTQFGSKDFSQYNCSTNHTWRGPEKVYEVTTFQRGNLVATLSTSNSLDLDIFILDSCNPNSCLAKNTNPAGTGSSVVRLNNAAPGTYFIVVDGQFGNTEGNFTLRVDCGTPPPPNCLIEDDFEFYAQRDRVSSRNPSVWRKWSSNVEDGIVSTDRSTGGNQQSMELNRDQFGEQDVVLKLGNQSRGIFKVSWDMFINNGDRAYYNIQSSQSNLQSGGVFGGTEFAGSQWDGFWFEVELYFDLDRNRMKAFANGEQLMNTSYDQQLGGINFYAIHDAHFYVDNVCMKEVFTFPLTDDAVSSSRNRENTSSGGLGITINPTITKNNTNTIETITTNTQVNNTLKAFPNPTNGIATITLNLPQEEELTLSVISQMGQLVKQIVLDKTQFVNHPVDLSDLPNGMYLIRLDGNNFHQNSKILKQE